MALVLALLALVYVAIFVVLTAGAPPADGAAPKPGCFIYVHRANMAGVDEEQPAGIKRAAKFGGAEVDVRLTKDGRPFLVHDTTLTRITGGADKRAVADLTAVELRQVRLAHGGRPWSFAHIVRVAARHQVPLVVELKAVPTGAPIRWTTAPEGVPTGFDRLAAATANAGWGDRIIWNNAGPTHADLLADPRFQPQTMLRASEYVDDPQVLDDARYGAFPAGQLSADRVDLITGHGAVPFMTTKAGRVAEAQALGVTTFQTHYPTKVKESCS